MIIYKLDIQIYIKVNLHFIFKIQEIRNFK